jgi:CRP-like cAMP-binding protein
MQPKVDTRPKNLILSALPDVEYRQLLPHLKAVTLKQGDILHHSATLPNSVYFLDTGVASLSVSNSNGVNLELSIVGNEAVVGERVIFRHGYFIIQCAMLSEGRGYKLSPKAFQDEFYKGKVLHDLILNQLEASLTETAQTALCNQTHRMEQRVSRWLLTFADRAHSEKLFLTQEFISNVLGVNRPTISGAAKTLHDKGLIDYNRGVITIIDREGLEAETCECYEVIKETVETYLSLRRKV